MPTLRDRVFQAYWRLQRPLTLGVRGVVSDEQGKVLLVRHTYTPGWHFPGGGVEKSETAFDALKRELSEEAKVTLLDPPDLVSVHSNHRNHPNDHILVYRANGWTKETFTPNAEIAEADFFNPGSPPKGVTNGTRRRLEEIFGDIAPRELW